MRFDIEHMASEHYGLQYTQSQAKRMHDILHGMMNTNEEWGKWVYEMYGTIQELLAELEKGE